MNREKWIRLLNENAFMCFLLPGFEITVTEYDDVEDLVFHHCCRKSESQQIVELNVRKRVKPVAHKMFTEFYTINGIATDTKRYNYTIKYVDEMNLINVIRETKGFGCNGFFGWDINGTRVNADYPFRDISFSYGKLYMWLRGTLWSHSASVHYHNERGIEPTIDITAPFRFDKKELLSQLNSELKECLKDPEWDFKNE